MSDNSVHKNDENLLEIRHSPELAQLYFAEFLRLYEHYRARALWNYAHGKRRDAKAPVRKAPNLATFTLKTRRDDWVRGAYQAGTPEFIARVNLAASPKP
jgi:hypothetical protein